MTDTVRSVSIAFALVATAAAAAAHDLWLVPSAARTAVGGEIKVFAQTGMEFGKSLSALTPDRIETFYVADADGRRDVGPGPVEGESLTATVGLRRSGVAVVALAIKPRFLAMDAEAFNSYLEEDGIPQILALRKEKGELDRPSREMYAKFAKTILRAGEGGPTALASTAVGLRIEIVPLQDPVGLRKGAPLAVQVFFEGKPLRGVWVYGLAKGESEYKDGRETDADGKCTVTLPGDGVVSLHTIHMRRHADSARYDWESFFATVTFETGVARESSP